MPWLTLVAIALGVVLGLDLVGIMPLAICAVLVFAISLGQLIIGDWVAAALSFTLWIPAMVVRSVLVTRKELRDADTKLAASDQSLAPVADRQPASVRPHRIVGAGHRLLRLRSFGAGRITRGRTFVPPRISSESEHGSRTDLFL